ncbi:hypothetical protein VFPPC_13103 [Pochonia chlamydosporia 170]|uniref:Uncharacterized protein n=1 Tax=Pochonia chlamydosporia 170 TaxID=1380566 RepID=A0A179G959_METCM|nr:hypothetical protein VFPPC_13103 [Pochonia chlamydosporia 170]OAQ73913.1 hypothetical protein VFPPC_13103 [Pochonia chlamydosporia 170]
MEAMTVNPLDTRLSRPGDSGDLSSSIHFSMSSESEDLSTPMTDASEPSNIPIWDPDTETLPDEAIPDHKTEQTRETKDGVALHAAIMGLGNSRFEIVRCLNDILSQSLIELSSKIRLCQSSLANCDDDVTMKYYASMLDRLLEMLEFTQKQLAVPQNQMKESTKKHFAELGITMLQPTENQFAVPQNTMPQLANNQFSGLENTMTDATFFTQQDYDQAQQQDYLWSDNGPTSFAQLLQDSTTMGDAVDGTVLPSTEFEGQEFNEQFADTTLLLRGMSVSREQQ